MKTFKSLKFKKHHVSIGNVPKMFKSAKRAVLKFKNGYGISVLFGECFYANGIDEYEIAVLYGDSLCYDTPITDDVIGHLKESEVTEIMKQIQLLPPRN